MLSNKLTFSLASLVVLLIATLCLPVAAQQTDSAFALGQAAAVTDVVELGEIAAGGFVVYARGAAADGAGLAAAPNTPRSVLSVATLPNLEEFFRNGGTIELVVDVHSRLGWHELVISEIMWALDYNGVTEGPGVDTADDRQWIEIYNAADRNVTLGAATDNTVVHILFSPGKSFSGDTANHLVVAEIAADNGVATSAELLTGTRAKSDAEGVTHKVIDRVSNIDATSTLGFKSRWTMPGENGNTDEPAGTNDFAAQKALVSANRKINYNTAKAKDGVVNGHEAGSWEATDVFARVNTASSLYVASPGMGVDPTTFSAGVATAAPAANKIIINEIHNGEGSDLDWIEIKNIMEPGSEDSDINIENWEISKVVPNDDDTKDKTEKLVDLPKYVLGAQEILLIVSRDPGETILAGGVNVVILGNPDEDQLDKGAQHRYYIEDGMSLPGNPLLLILRDNHEKNAAGKYHENIQDTAGGLEAAGYTNDRSGKTEVFPFKSTASLGGDKAADVGKMGSAWARKPKGVKAGYYIVDNTNGRHKGAWESVTGETTMGVGYDRNVDLAMAHGTPGYENMIANTIDDYDDTDPDPDGMEIASNLISISEIMYDAGPRWNQVQWIELYNQSMSQAVNIAGWELEIRNATDEVESYVDSSFIFNDAVILPNQTLLIVSGPGANDVPENRVYNLFAQHRRELGLTQRGSVLLSPDGFYLKLTDKANITRDHRTDEDVVVDEAGNVSVKGASRIVEWELPARDPSVRQSLVRQYGTRGIGGADAGADDADDGTMADSWVQSDVTGAGLAYFGHRNDIGTPGYRLGGPLPVTLATFRPVRDKATGEVVITWVTESELNNAGFNILRRDGKDGVFKVINLQGMIAGHGTTSEKHVYTYTDKTATKPNVVYYYQIEDVSLDGNRTTLRTTHLRGNVNAAGKATTTWGDLKLQK